MPLDLEKHLKKLCDEHDPKLDLYDRLIRVRTSADSIWQEQRLKWFTDHRAKTHSRYIVQHLGYVLGHLQDTPQKLNPHELYILLAACYLHDIGMQDFQSYNGRSVEQFSEEDYKRIRKTHPERTKELIITRTLNRERDEFRIDIDDDPQYLVPIALVSQGHGSDYFIDTVKELNERPHRPGNSPLRGGLLTSLLLIADELDLHEQRASFPPEFSLSPVSLMHHHVHHYVTGVEIINGCTLKHRRIRLTIEFPEDSDVYRSDVRNWIATKLRKQIKLTNSCVEQFTQGELIWDEQIEVRETIDHYGVRRSLLTPNSIIAWHELKLDLISGQTVNRDKLIESIKETVKNGIDHFHSVQIIDREDSDWSHIVKQLTAICVCNGITYIYFGFHMSAGHDPSDILYRISCDMEKYGMTCTTYNYAKKLVNEAQPESLVSLGNALITDIEKYTANHALVMLLERIDKADSNVLDWVVKWLLPEFSSRDIKSLLIFTQFQSGRGETTDDNVNSFQLASFTKDQIIEHLQAEFGFPSDQAENEAKYLLSLSSGMPGAVHRGFSVKRIEGVKII